MRFRLSSRDSDLFELFAVSAGNLVEGAQLLSDLLVASSADYPDIAGRMQDAKRAADIATHAILRELHTTFVTPFDREDIYRLAANLDDVMDAMEAAADLVSLYDLSQLPPYLSEQVIILERAAALSAEVMPRLRKTEDLERYWTEIDRLEDEANRLYRRALARLFNEEKHDAITVMKLKEVIDQLELAANAFEHVANTVKTIALKEL